MNGFLVRFLPAMALWSAVVGSFASFSNVYLSKSLHIPLPQIGLVFSAAQILQLGVGLMTPLFFRWLGLERGVLAAQVSSAIALGLLAGTNGHGMAIGLFLSFSATQWMSSPGLYNVLMSRVAPEERGWASAATLFCNAVVQSGLTACAGILIVRLGYSRTLAGACGLAAMAALLFAIFVVPARNWLGKSNHRQASKVLSTGKAHYDVVVWNALDLNKDGRKCGPCKSNVTVLSFSGIFPSSTDSNRVTIRTCYRARR